MIAAKLKQLLFSIAVASPIVAMVDANLISVRLVPPDLQFQLEDSRSNSTPATGDGLVRRLSRLGARIEPSSLGRRDICLVDKYTPAFVKEYQLGELVIYRSPLDYHKLLSGRIVARAKDRIIPRDIYGEWRVRIPDGHCWVEADDKSSDDKAISMDSNILGPVALGLIVGRVISFPFSENRTAKPHITIDQLKRAQYRGI
eukprot:Partr_v1_DN27975_c2_g1_i1_m11442 putative Mitochondrial inner membrane protease subunit